ncbi:uncharacterized protein LOC121392757 isoform X2 [Gigantopelta aegis]|uniref:uncharacterized protein LOC121392757 isoform X2 n=1 Tax=Gigantopelta aegis TaxID=1735272 RepID=UPI001B88DE65|nr:uncharacterized protein LOC121392757 isoform X2 [Gigantopelta aegis]
MLVTLVRACELCVAFGRNNIAFGRCHHYIRVQPALCLCEDPIHSRCHHYIRVQPALCLCEDPIHSRLRTLDLPSNYSGIIEQFVKTAANNTVEGLLTADMWLSITAD